MGEVAFFKWSNKKKRKYQSSHCFQELPHHTLLVWWAPVGFLEGLYSGRVPCVKEKPPTVVTRAVVTIQTNPDKTTRNSAPWVKICETTAEANIKKKKTCSHGVWDQYIWQPCLTMNLIQLRVKPRVAPVVPQKQSWCRIIGWKILFHEQQDSHWLLLLNCSYPAVFYWDDNYRVQFIIHLSRALLHICLHSCLGCRFVTLRKWGEDDLKPALKHS